MRKGNFGKLENLEHMLQITYYPTILIPAANTHTAPVYAWIGPEARFQSPH